MLSYTALRNTYGQFTNNSTASNLTNGDAYINNALRQIYSSAPWDFLEVTGTASTVAAQQFYSLPNDYDKLVAVTVQIGSVQYIPKEVADKTTWDFLNQNTNIQSNIPAYFFILNGQIGFYPKPSSSGNTINYTYRRKVRDLSIDDYTTGTIAVVANGATTVTGNATAWTSQMVGRYLRITRTNAATSGDGEWYPITAVGGATSLTIGRPYGGTTLAAASAGYYIVEAPALPETYHQMPVYAAAVWYWNANGNPQKAKYYREMHDQMMKQLRSDHLSKTTDDSIKDIVGGAMQNPNLYVMN